jgi:hypothetical protein
MCNIPQLATILLQQKINTKTHHKGIIHCRLFEDAYSVYVSILPTSGGLLQHKTEILHAAVARGNFLK